MILNIVPNLKSAEEKKEMKEESKGQDLKKLGNDVSL